MLRRLPAGWDAQELDEEVRVQSSVVAEQQQQLQLARSAAADAQGRAATLEAALTHAQVLGHDSRSCDLRMHVEDLGNSGEPAVARPIYEMNSEVHLGKEKQLLEPDPRTTGIMEGLHERMQTY